MKFWWNKFKKVSNKWSQKHFIKKINPEEIINKIDSILESIHEPLGGLPSWNVYEEISKNYKVALNGTELMSFLVIGKWEKLDPFFGNEVSFERFAKKFFNLRYYTFEKQKF